MVSQKKGAFVDTLNVRAHSTDNTKKIGQQDMEKTIGTKLRLF